MSMKTIITSLALGALLVPVLSSAQSFATSTVMSDVATEAQVFTACSQSAIEVRDSAISAARTSYNNAMTVALDARKEAEKEAVAMEDAKAKKNAIRTAVEEYKEDVTRAQDSLTKARKEAWSAFETHTKECREMSKENRELIRDASKDGITELRVLQADLKADAKVPVQEQRAEVKSFRETLRSQLESLRSFFKRSTSTEAVAR
jgi:cation transport regulator ChaB